MSSASISLLSVNYERLNETGKEEIKEAVTNALTGLVVSILAACAIGLAAYWLAPGALSSITSNLEFLLRFLCVSFITVASIFELGGVGAIASSINTLFHSLTEEEKKMYIEES